MDTLNPILRRLSWRLRLVDGWLFAQRSLWAAMLAALLVQLAGHFWPVESLWLWTLGVVVIWLAAVTSYAIIKPHPRMHIAQRVDRELGLRERLSTSLALYEWQSAFPESLVSAQHTDALDIAQHIQVRQDLPLHWLRRYLLAAGALSACLIVLAIAPNPMDAVLAQRAAVAKEVHQQAEKIEQLKKEIVTSQALTAEEREELLRELDDLAKALRENPGNLEQAMADLSKTEQFLQEKMDPNFDSRLANLQALAARLQSLAGMQNDPNRDQTKSTEEALNQLAEELSKMDEDQRKELAEGLAQMAAQASQAGNRDLAQALSSLAQAVQSGDLESASQAARQAGQAAQQTQSQLAKQIVLQHALSQVQASSQASAQAGRALAQSQAPSSSQNPGNQGQSQNQGQVGSGGGTKANTLPPATRTGKAGRPQGNAPDAEAVNLSSQVYIPRQGGQGAGDPFFIPGQDTGQGETQVTEGQSPLPGSSNPALVPYSQVYATYLNVANQAIQQGNIPPSLSDFVQQYFTQLEP